MCARVDFNNSKRIIVSISTAQNKTNFSAKSLQGTNTKLIKHCLGSTTQLKDISYNIIYLFRRSVFLSGSFFNIAFQLIVLSSLALFSGALDSLEVLFFPARSSRASSTHRYWIFIFSASSQISSPSLLAVVTFLYLVPLNYCSFLIP